MRKAVFGRQLGRTSHQRKALFKGLIGSLLEKGKIETTLAKAKAVRAKTEKLITKAKKGSLTDRRVIFRFLSKKTLVNRLVDDIAPRLKERKSGYLRILKLGRRQGDGAEMAQISFVDELTVTEKKKEKKEKKTVRAIEEPKK